MELNEVFRIIEKRLEGVNDELGFYKTSDFDCLAFQSDKGAYKITYDAQATIMAFECIMGEVNSDSEYGTVSKSLFDINTYEERDAKSFANEISDEVKSLFGVKKKVDFDKVKMPKAVSKNKAKNGVISYDVDSLANRFALMFPQMKPIIKQNIVDYDEFLPETFFTEYGADVVLDVIRRGDDQECKKLFKMLNEIYEDGTNEVQDIIGVTILGAMKNDKDMMDTADKYMSDYMAGPVHEINKITRKNNSLTKKLLNPPPYKPKKKRTNPLQSSLLSQNK